MLRIEDEPHPTPFPLHLHIEVDEIPFWAMKPLALGRKKGYNKVTVPGWVPYKDNNRVLHAKVNIRQAA